MQLEIGVDDPRRDDVRSLIARHLAFAAEVTPPGHVHALGDDRLVDPAITFFSARLDGALLGIGALRELDAENCELKSMHTAAEARGRGVAAAVLEHLVAAARARGYRRVSLETGTSAAFAPARALYRSRGFEPSEPFGDYTANPYSVCFTMTLRDGVA